MTPMREPTRFSMEAEGAYLSLDAGMYGNYKVLGRGDPTSFVSSDLVLHMACSSSSHADGYESLNATVTPTQYGICRSVKVSATSAPMSACCAAAPMSMSVPLSWSHMTQISSGGTAPGMVYWRAGTALTQTQYRRRSGIASGASSRNARWHADMIKQMARVLRCDSGPCLQWLLASLRL